MRTQEQIVQDLKAGEYDLVGVIDAVVDLHGIIGVGRYTFADHVGAYIRTRKGTIPAGGVPVLVVVSGGVAHPYAQEPARVVVVDRDDIDAGEECPVLPAGVGFEALCKAAGIEAGEVEFKDKE